VRQGARWYVSSVSGRPELSEKRARAGPWVRSQKPAWGVLRRSACAGRGEAPQKRRLALLCFSSQRGPRSGRYRDTDTAAYVARQCSGRLRSAVSGVERNGRERTGRARSCLSHRSALSRATGMQRCGGYDGRAGTSSVVAPQSSVLHSVPTPIDRSARSICATDGAGPPGLAGSRQKGFGRALLRGLTQLLKTVYTPQCIKQIRYSHATGRRAKSTPHADALARSSSRPNAPAPGVHSVPKCPATDANSIVLETCNNGLCSAERRRAR
jgi:hypothetical protein